MVKRNVEYIFDVYNTTTKKRDWGLLGGKERRDCEKGQGFVGPAAERIDFASAAAGLGMLACYHHQPASATREMNVTRCYDDGLMMMMDEAEAGRARDTPRAKGD